MKSILISPLLLLLVVVIGCSTLEVNSYKVIGSIVVSVDGAMNGWGDYVRSGKATLEQEAKVKGLFNQYQEVMKVTQKVVNTYKSTQGSNETELKKAMLLISSVSGDLILFINSLIKP